MSETRDLQWAPCPEPRTGSPSSWLFPSTFWLRSLGSRSVEELCGPRYFLTSCSSRPLISSCFELPSLWTLQHPWWSCSEPHITTTAAQIADTHGTGVETQSLRSHGRGGRRGSACSYFPYSHASVSFRIFFPRCKIRFALRMANYGREPEWTVPGNLNIQQKNHNNKKKRSKACAYYITELWVSKIKTN